MPDKVMRPCIAGSEFAVEHDNQTRSVANLSRIHVVAEEELVFCLCVSWLVIEIKVAEEVVP